jgi:flagellar hook-associated protein 2
MSTINFTGLATGLDTASIVSQLVALRRQPIDKLNAQKSQYTQIQSAYSDLKEKLEALRSAADAMGTPASFGACSASSSDEGLVTATSGAQAQQGTYSVVVSQLASAQKDISQGFSSQVAEVGTGTFSLTVNGQRTDITLATGDSSLTSLRNAINDAAVGVRATIINDGTSGSPYHLVLTAAETGTASAFSFDFSGLSGGTAPVMAQIADAADAELTIDTVPIVSASNTVSGVLDGITLNLVHADPDTEVTIGVQHDADAIAAKVQALADAYNDLMSWVQDHTAKGALLQGDSLVSGIADRITDLAVSPLAGSHGAYSLFAEVGLTQQDDGTLAFDSDKFASALADDYTKVQDLFVQDGNSQGKASQLMQAVDNLTQGDHAWFDVAEDGIQDKMDQIDDTVARYQRSLDSYQQTLERQFTAMETLVAGLQAQSNYLTNWTAQLNKSK